MCMGTLREGGAENSIPQVRLTTGSLLRDIYEQPRCCAFRKVLGKSVDQARGDLLFTEGEAKTQKGKVMVQSPTAAW